MAKEYALRKFSRFQLVDFCGKWQEPSCFRNFWEWILSKSVQYLWCQSLCSLVNRAPVQWSPTPLFMCCFRNCKWPIQIGFTSFGEGPFKLVSLEEIMQNCIAVPQLLCVWMKCIHLCTDTIIIFSRPWGMCDWNDESNVEKKPILEKVCKFAEV